MSDFFSNSDDEKAIDVILSQAMDSTVLYQLAAINCAGFTDSSPQSQLESRFHWLKSFLSSAPLSLLSHPSNEPQISDPGEEEKGGEKKVPTTCSKKFPEEKSYPSDNSNDSPVSPPVKIGCFLCTPKIISKIKNNENLGLDLGKNGRKILSDLSNFSVRSHKRMKRNEEEEKNCEEAEKLVEWVKQASARIVVPGFEDELSDDSDEENVRLCFLCSHKVSEKKDKENLWLDWELSSDLSNFSVSDQRRLMKIAMEKEERACVGAENLVMWVRQALARMDVSGIEDELSDGENVKFH